MEYCAVTFNYKNTHVLSIHSSRKKAESARFNFAKTYIRNFRYIIKEYVRDWIYYHSVEYPDNPLPKIRLIIEQFLSEECLLLIEEFEMDKPCNFGYLSYRDVFSAYGDDFYMNLYWACNQHRPPPPKRKRKS